MVEKFELKGPCGRLVVRRGEVSSRLGRGYVFASAEDEARFKGEPVVEDHSEFFVDVDPGDEADE